MPRSRPAPARGRPAPRRPVRPERTGGLIERSLALVRRLPDLALVDRLVRGRAWIPVLGLMLAGIVAMQVELLKLSSSIGHSIDRGASLQSQNEQLRARVATLADDQRIERIASGMGMVMPSPDGVVFLATQPGADVSQAVAKMHAPDPSATSAVQAAAQQASSGPTPASAASGSVTSAAASSAAASVSSATATVPTGATGNAGAADTTGSTSSLALASSASQSGPSTATGN